MRAFLPVILTASLVGCATVGDDKVQQLRSGTTIAPVSVMGDAFAVRQVGATVFQNEKRDVDVTQWGFDRHTETVAGQLVSGKGKFQVAQADAGGIRKTIKLQEDFWSGSNKIKGGAGPLASFAAQSKADYVLLIAPTTTGDPFMNSNQTIAGYGIYQRSFLGLKRSMNFITLRAILVDGKSGEEIARTQCVASTPREDWLEPSSFTPSEGTRAGVQKLVEDGLRKCLSSLNLS